MKTVKFDAYGYIEIDNTLFEDPVQAKLYMLGETATSVKDAALRGEVIIIVAAAVSIKDENDKDTGEFDIVAPDYEASHMQVPSFGNVRAFFDL